VHGDLITKKDRNCVSKCKVTYNKKGNAVTAKRRGRLIAGKFNDSHC